MIHQDPQVLVDYVKHHMANIMEIFLLTIGASFVQRTTGFGFGIFIMTLLPFLMPSYGEATTLSGLLALTTSTIICIRMRKYITWKRLIPILLTFIIVSTPTIFLSKCIDNQSLNKILGITLILTSLYFAFFSGKIKIKTTVPYQIGAGTISGVMGGFFGMQGPPAVLYFISSEPDKNHYIAMAQIYFLLGNVVMTIVRAANGFLTETVGRNYLFCLAAVLVGTLLGSWAFKHIPGKIFPYVVYSYIGISGLVIFLTA
ncbi:MAG: sulfite exporter TauE/SafE family protein [Bacteroidales bacterium]|nr:sulfite exporter TauE/SafE family protein [Bacteroidales bacterium]